MRAFWLCLLVLLCTARGAASESTADRAAQERFTKATAALKQGSYQEAIDQYELMADHGVLHPDLSYNRALAYVLRAESNQQQPGDLGRAAAALSELLLQRPDDAEAQEVLRLVREEIGRRRARQGAEQVNVSPSLTRAAVGLLAETTWAILAALGSALLTIGIAFRFWAKHAGTRLAGGVLSLVGPVMLLTCGAFALGARHFRTTSRPAVVVVEEARLLDAAGKPLAGSTASIVEGQQVFVVDEQSVRAKVEWGTVEGWVNRAQLQILKP